MCKAWRIHSSVAEPFQKHCSASAAGEYRPRPSLQPPPPPPHHGVMPKPPPPPPKQSSGGYRRLRRGLALSPGRQCGVSACTPSAVAPRLLFSGMALRRAALVLRNNFAPTAFLSTVSKTQRMRASGRHPSPRVRAGRQCCAARSLSPTRRALCFSGLCVVVLCSLQYHASLSRGDLRFLPDHAQREGLGPLVALRDRCRGIRTPDFVAQQRAAGRGNRNAPLLLSGCGWAQGPCWPQFGVRHRNSRLPTGHVHPGTHASAPALTGQQGFHVGRLIAWT